MVLTNKRMTFNFTYLAKLLENRMLNNSPFIYTCSHFLKICNRPAEKISEMYLLIFKTMVFAYMGTSITMEMDTNRRQQTYTRSSHLSTKEQWFMFFGLTSFQRQKNHPGMISSYNSTFNIKTINSIFYFLKWKPYAAAT